MRVLMAVDGSKQCTQDLLSGCRILSSGNHEYHLLSVVPAAPHKRLSPEEGALQDRLQKRAARRMDVASARLAAEGIDAKALVHSGSPARVLLRCAQDFDIVVAGASSQGNRSYAGLGPVASRLLEHAPHCVLLARKTPGDASLRILAPIDGSPESLEALGRLSKLMDLQGSEVTLLHVVETPWLRLVDDQDWLSQEIREEEEQDAVELQTDMELEFTQQGEKILEEGRQRLPSRTSVNTMLYHGVPVDEILSEANSGGYDLLLLAGVGENNLKHRILGSVSSRVAWNAPCSVLLIRGGE